MHRAGWVRCLDMCLERKGSTKIETVVFGWVFGLHMFAACFMGSISSNITQSCELPMLPLLRAVLWEKASPAPFWSSLENAMRFHETSGWSFAFRTTGHADRLTSARGFAEVQPVPNEVRVEKRRPGKKRRNDPPFPRFVARSRGLTCCIKDDHAMLHAFLLSKGSKESVPGPPRTCPTRPESRSTSQDAGDFGVRKSPSSWAPDGGLGIFGLVPGPIHVWMGGTPMVLVWRPWFVKEKGADYDQPQELPIQPEILVGR